MVANQPAKNLSVDLNCVCGQVSAHIEADDPIHLVCYCDDCQGYAAWLEKRRRAPWGRVTSVDAQGGSRTCQVFGAEVRILSGLEKLQPTVLDPALVPSGRPHLMFRLHTACCYTPLFSASWRELATVGFYAANVCASGATGSFVQPDAATACWGNNPVLGPPAYRINTRWARASPGLPTVAGSAGFPVGFLARFAYRNFIRYRKRREPYPWPLPPAGEAQVRRETR